jgi:soluble lytic murein transglycosylase-like protein
MTAGLAHFARHRLVIAGLAVLVAALVAFLPVGLGREAGQSPSTPLLAASALGNVSALQRLSALSGSLSAPDSTSPASLFANAAGTGPTTEALSQAANIPSPTPTTAPPQLSSSADAPVATEIRRDALSAVPSVATATVVATLPPATAAATATPVATQQIAPIQAAIEPARTSPATVSSLDATLAASPWPAELWPTVKRVIQCESSGNPAAVGPGGYVGLMQVSPRLHGPVPADPVGQLTQAYDVYLREGWGAWGCY